MRGVAEIHDGDSSLYELCHTAALRRTHLDHRATVVAVNTDDLRAKLTSLLAGEAVDGDRSRASFAWNEARCFCVPGTRGAMGRNGKRVIQLRASLSNGTRTLFRRNTKRNGLVTDGTLIRLWQLRSRWRKLTLSSLHSSQLRFRWQRFGKAGESFPLRLWVTAWEKSRRRSSQGR